MTVERRAAAVRIIPRIVLLSALAPAFLAVDLANPLSDNSASAQEFGGGLFGRLFGSRPRRSMDDGPSGTYPPPRYYLDPPVQRRQQRQTPPRPRASAKKNGPAAAGGAAAAAGTVASAPAPVEKAADAKVVLVVGDFMALSLAKGLGAATAQNAGMRVVDRTDGSSGLVRDDHFDWPQRIAGIVEEEKPAAVIVMLGSNDRQAIRTDGTSEDLRSQEWTEEYVRRMDALAAAVREKKLPLVWVGLPAFKSSDMNDDVAFFNELYRQAATKVGGEFVDVWDGFVDANGAFASSGPDVAGQPARLRNSDGITMTPQGARKLAFFAEKPLEKILGGSLDGTAVAARPETPKAVPQNPANATSVPAVGLASPSLDGGEDLLAGPAQAVAGTQPSPRERLVNAGTPLTGSIGRADNFAWNTKGGSIQSRPDAPVVSRGSVNLEAVRSGTGGFQPPKPTPSLDEAIIEDWTAQEKADAAKRAASEQPNPAGSAAPR
ncbi:SGNH/GDSL hydrolase family protein [Aureimonas leprariae]|uniref:DUF459 domain-containing protein n=1 Tax=Plantimonas leprariae TaxID=2615207 RepID=A0A7V7PMV5_9HYPH|nr:SGNH family hydrolase [Aureimonas leprariae]KAB0678773.1 DUF459 domain-containing protein [Aureimonas leprariae]